MQKNYLIRATFHCLLCSNFSTLYKMGKMINYVHFLSIFCIIYKKKIIIHSFVTIKAMLVSRPSSGRWIHVTNDHVYAIVAKCLLKICPRRKHPVTQFFSFLTSADQNYNCHIFHIFFYFTLPFEKK